MKKTDRVKKPLFSHAAPVFRVIITTAAEDPAEIDFASASAALPEQKKTAKPEKS